MTKAENCLGRRMKEAADAKGLTAIDIAGLMHTSDVSVRRWWSGIREPRGKTMEQYARMVGQSVEWFHRPDDDAVNQETRRVLLEIANLVMGGRASQNHYHH